LLGSIELTEDEQGNNVLSEILNGGEYSDDYNCRRVACSNEPHEALLEIIREKDLRRPVRNR